MGMFDSSIGSAVGGLISGIGGLFKKKPFSYKEMMTHTAPAELAQLGAAIGDPTMQNMYRTSEKYGDEYKKQFGQSLDDTINQQKAAAAGRGMGYTGGSGGMFGA